LATPGRKAGEPDHLPPLPAKPAPRLLHELAAHTGKVRCLAFSPDGKTLASGGADNVVCLWDVGSGKQRGPGLRHKYPVRALAWSPDGKRLASGSWGGGYEAAIDLWLWNPAKPDETKTLPWMDRTGTPSRADVRALAFSPDGSKLASGGGPLRLWDLKKGGDSAVRNWQETFPSYIYGVAFSPDGKMVAAGCHEIGDNVRVWDPDEEGDPIVLRGNEQPFGLAHSDVSAVVAFVGGGQLFVRVTSDGRGAGQNTASAWVWKVDAARRQFKLRDKCSLPGGSVFAVVGAADGKLRIAVAEGPSAFPAGFGPGSKSPPGEVKLCDEATKSAPPFDSKHKESITALAFSPDGRLLATGSEDQTVKLWDLTP
jgi:WD40 repeat protein